MKVIYLILIYMTVFFTACSIDDVLKPANQINIALMETVDTVKAVPGSNINFKFIASTNLGKIVRIEIEEKSHPFDVTLDSMNFTLVDQSLELTIDSLGFLSRPVSTVMALFPMTVPKNDEYVGETLSMQFKVTDDQNNVARVRPCFRIVNIKTNNPFWFYRAPSGDRAMFYGFDDNGKDQSFRSPYGEEDNIDMIVATDLNKKTFVLNPLARSTEEFMHTLSYYTYYECESMRKTVFMKLSDCNFEKVDDVFIEKLDFSKVEDQLQLEDKDVFAFMTQEGKKGIVRADISAYGDVTFTSLIQIVAK